MGRLFYLVAALLRCASAASDSSQLPFHLSITVTLNRVRCKRLLCCAFRFFDNLRDNARRLHPPRIIQHIVRKIVGLAFCVEPFNVSVTEERDVDVAFV